MENTVIEKIRQAAILIEEAEMEHLNSMLPVSLMNMSQVEKMLLEFQPFWTAKAAIKKIVKTK